jgi:serine/threonine-protein kinase HipA
VTYAYNPDGAWTSQHQMTLSGKRDGFSRADLLAAASFADIKKRRAGEILDDVFSAVKRWKSVAQKAGISAPMMESIRKALRVTMK